MVSTLPIEGPLSRDYVPSINCEDINMEPRSLDVSKVPESRSLSPRCHIHLGSKGLVGKKGA